MGLRPCCLNAFRGGPSRGFAIYMQAVARRFDASTVIWRTVLVATSAREAVLCRAQLTHSCINIIVLIVVT